MVLSLDRWVGKTAVVTGASVGIGAGIAELLVKAGINVVGVARRKEKIEALSQQLSKEKGKLYAVKADLRNEADILNAFKWIKTNVGPVHILINNAGLNQFNELINGDTEKWKTVLDVNILGLCIATREAIKQMQENNIDGHIIHLNSVAGHKVVDIAGLNVYAASKYAVTALTETLRLELNRAQSKIKITSVSPGAVKSEFQETAGLDMNKPELKRGFDRHSFFALGIFGTNFDAMWVAYFKGTFELLSKMSWLYPEDIADGIVYVLSTPPHVQVHELIIKPINEPF